MRELVLHIGAHRTGTTSMQRFLIANEGFLQDAGIHLIYPPVSREIELDEVNPGSPRALVSEENMLGTMEENISHLSLYPHAKEKLQRYSNLLARTTKVILSIRDIEAWWRSAIAFCAVKGGRFPTSSEIEEISNSDCSWLDVVDGVREAAPHAAVVVRDFDWKRDNPKQQLRKITAWAEWSETKVNKSTNNRSPNKELIARRLIEQKSFESLRQLGRDGPFNPFSFEQGLALRRRYQEDIESLSERSDLEFLIDREAIQKPSRSAHIGVEKDSKPSQSTTCFLHIGKTGGTFLKSIMDAQEKVSPTVFLGGHGDTLVSTMQDFGQKRRLAFFFREPERRLISGFFSRMRQGRPTYDVNWTTAEAAAFSFFCEPDELVLALQSNDERLKSAALFAFRSIHHLKLDYRHYLHSSEAVRYEHSFDGIAFCCETNEIDKNLDSLLACLGVADTSFEKANYNAFVETADYRLSKAGRANLREFWSGEYEIYESCKAVAGELGYA